SGTVYNKMKQISGRYGVREDQVAQTALNASAGIDIGGSLVGKTLGIKGGVSVQSNQSSNAAASRAEEEITQLGESQEFKSVMSHAQNWSKSHNYDLGDQNLKQSVQGFGDHYEKSHQHQKNASAAYETSQHLSKQIDYVSANSQRIDTVENQRFAGWAAEQLGGYEKLEEVARNDLGRLQGLGAN